jgi:cytochrome c553
MTIRMLLLAILALFTAPVLADPSMPSDPSDPVTEQELQQLIAQCVACHGEHGDSDDPAVPPISGLSAVEMLDAVEDFYFFERHCPKGGGATAQAQSGARDMCDVSDRMTREEVLAIGRHFESGGSD